MEKQQEDNKKRMEDLKVQISAHSKEVAEGYKKQIADLKTEIDDIEKEK